MTKEKIFSGKVTSILLCLFACLLWGSLFPVIKLGYSAFKIASNDIPSIILFAGLRFFISGLALVLASSIGQKKFIIPKKSNLKYTLLGALFTIVLHYSLTYVALSLGEGSRSAIIKQVGFLFLSCFAFIFDRQDKWSARKMVAGIIGFSGIIATNSGEGGFTVGLVDLILILSSFCSIYGTVIAKRSSRAMSSSCFVAYSQLFGGIFLSVVGLILGGGITYIDFGAILVFAYICAASIGAYLIWNILLEYNDLSKMAIVKFAEPLFAVILSGAILNEDILKPTYLIALVLILTAILVENIKIKRTPNVEKKP